MNKVDQGKKKQNKKYFCLIYFVTNYYCNIKNQKYILYLAALPALCCFQFLDYFWFYTVHKRSGHKRSGHKRSGHKRYLVF